MRTRRTYTVRPATGRHEVVQTGNGARGWTYVDPTGRADAHYGGTEPRMTEKGAREAVAQANDPTSFTGEMYARMFRTEEHGGRTYVRATHEFVLTRYATDVVTGERLAPRTKVNELVELGTTTVEVTAA